MYHFTHYILKFGCKGTAYLSEHQILMEFLCKKAKKNSPAQGAEESFFLTKAE